MLRTRWVLFDSICLFFIVKCKDTRINALWFWVLGWNFNYKYPVIITVVQKRGKCFFLFHLFHPYLLVDLIKIFLAIKLFSFPQGGLIPLHNASSYGHLDIAALLIRFQTAVNATDRWGFTPLHEAAQKGRTQLCALLLAHGADPYLKNQVSLSFHNGLSSLPFFHPIFLSFPYLYQVDSSLVS